MGRNGRRLLRVVVVIAIAAPVLGLDQYRRMNQKADPAFVPTVAVL